MGGEDKETDWSKPPEFPTATPPAKGLEKPWPFSTELGHFLLRFVPACVCFYLGMGLGHLIKYHWFGTYPGVMFLGIISLAGFAFQIEDRTGPLIVHIDPYTAGRARNYVLRRGKDILVSERLAQKIKPEHMEFVLARQAVSLSNLGMLVSLLALPIGAFLFGLVTTASPLYVDIPIIVLCFAAPWCKPLFRPYEHRLRMKWDVEALKVTRNLDGASRTLPLLPHILEMPYGDNPKVRSIDPEARKKNLLQAAEQLGL
jgi:hypothetical protein